jgi:hypothetical protein
MPLTNQQLKNAKPKITKTRKMFVRSSSTYQSKDAWQKRDEAKRLLNNVLIPAHRGKQKKNQYVPKQKIVLNLLPLSGFNKTTARGQQAMQKLLVFDYTMMSSPLSGKNQSRPLVHLNLLDCCVELKVGKHMKRHIESEPISAKFSDTLLLPGGLSLIQLGTLRVLFAP